MASSDRRPRRGRVRVLLPRGRAQPPWVATLVGIGLAAVSAGVTAVFSLTAAVAGALPGADHLPAAAGGRPDPVVTRFGAVLACAGLALAAWGLVESARDVAAARGRARQRDPWLADHPWRRGGASDEAPRQGGRAILTGIATLGLAGALGFAVWPALGSGGQVFVLALSAIVGAGVVLVPLGWGLRRMLRGAMRRGGVELRFRRFPFFLGGAVEADLVCAPGLPPLGALAVTLRCIQEARTVERTGEGSGWSIQRDERWSETRRIEKVATGGRRVEIRFALPAAPELSTELSVNPPRYWELEVTSETGPLEPGAVFLVPVYAAPLETTSPRGTPVAGARRA